MKDVTKKLTDLGLKVTTTDENSDTVDEGYVTRTNPASGDKAKTGDTVTVYVSSGAKKITVPQLLDNTESYAEQALTSAGLSLGSVTEEYSDKPEGTVIKQSINAGSSVSADTKIDIVVSKGSERVEVPNLKYSTTKEAKDKLESVGLELGSVTEQYYSGVDVSVGGVISQSVNPKTMVEKGTKINIVISKGQEPVPETTQPHTETPEPGPDETAAPEPGAE